MLENYTAILGALLDIPSVTGYEEQCAHYLCHLLRRNIPYDILHKQEVAPGRYNVILINGRPRLTLTSHIDTVPTNVPRLNADGKISGTGACDAKGQIAVQLAALGNAIAAGLTDYACFYVIGEEKDSIGAIAAMTYPALGGEYLLNGEPTGNKFVSYSSGAMECHLLAQGVSAHSSISGSKSAIHGLAEDIAALLKTESDDYSINVGRIVGGSAANVVSDNARAELCIRMNCSAKEVVTSVGKQLRHSELHIVSCAEPLSFHVPSQYKNDSVDVSFCSDCAYYTNKFCNIMMCGPGEITRAHTNYEYIEEKEMAEAVQIIESLLLRI